MSASVTRPQSCDGRFFNTNTTRDLKTTIASSSVAANAEEGEEVGYYTSTARQQARVRRRWTIVLMTVSLRGQGHTLATTYFVDLFLDGAVALVPSHDCRDSTKVANHGINAIQKLVFRCQNKVYIVYSRRLISNSIIAKHK